MKQPNFLHAETYSQKLNGQKFVWPIWSLDSKTDYLKNEQMELTDFLHAFVPCKLKVDWKCLGWVWSKTGVANLGLENWLYLKNEPME